jgi:hypothetical protein
MKRYNLLNNIFGWIAFVIAAITYLLTIEPTASFWDCGEFITSSYKMEVGHPPGAPFFNLTAKFFSLFASDASHVAKMINSMSALLSAATILFLFWSITHLAKKLICQDETKEITLGQTIAIIGSGLVGSLIYTFSDTFWFSAVEAEVYGFSSMFTALVFWLILKWESHADKPNSDKWIILIAYMVGLSIGVHLLNLLCIPAMVLVYYFKKAKTADLKGTLLALLGSFGLIVVLMYGIIPGFTKVGGWFELFFVNALGFSYNTGALIYLLVLVGTIIWSLYETMRKKINIGRTRISFILCLSLAGVPFIGSNIILWIILFGAIAGYIFTRKTVNLRLVNTSVLSLMVILIGFSTYALIPIRSSANTPMDQNSPEDVFTLAEYLNREQYGETPLFYGKTYASDVKRDAQGSPIVASEKKKYDKVVKKSPKDKDHYFIASTSDEYEYTNTQLFPRMYSNEQNHLKGYKNWGGVTDPSVAPTLMQNLQYFFSYQLNFMYWRYFMWNFSGRQNDNQNTGGITNGNWITGIPFIDEHMLGLGPQDNLAPDIINKGHNTYFMLPLLLGIIGIIFQLRKKERGEQGFWVTFMLFFMTGIAIVIYLNQKPYEPRERDYAYAGSFYAFSIWIGLGVAGIWELLSKKVSSTVAASIATILTLLIPVRMASENWDDHDRSGRYTMRDFGMNYLRSCEPNAILFTNGDNDTFPLWYAQDVEGFRTDVRVCNLSYLQTDWYVDQMRRQAYNSAPLPIKWDKQFYIGDKGAYAYVITKRQIEEALQKNNVPQHGNINDVQQFNNIAAADADGNVDMWGQMYDKNAYKDTVPLDNLMTKLRSSETYAPKNPFGIDKGLIVTGNLVSLNIKQDKVDWKSLNTQPTKTMLINLGNKNVLYRQELMILEMLDNINNDNWKRPIYFAVTVGSEMYMNMKQFFQLEGLSYRITPNTSKTGVNTDVMYDNLVNKFKWGGIENPKVYLDENNLRSCITYRYMFAQLLQSLLAEGKSGKALTAVDRCVQVIPPTTVPYGGESVFFASVYYQLRKPAKGEAILNAISNRATKNLQWFNRLNTNQTEISSIEIWENLTALDQVAGVYQQFDLKKYQAVKEQLLGYSQIYFSKRNSALGNSLLKSITDGSIQGYYNAKDSAVKRYDEAFVGKAMQLMQRVSPELLRQYQQGANTNGSQER